MSVPEETGLLLTARRVDQRAHRLFRDYFGVMQPAQVDYLSLFTFRQAEYERLCGLAHDLGSKVAEKNGQVFEISDHAEVAISTNIVRVCEPAETELIGCADFIMPDYEAIRDRLAASGHQEEQKTTNGVSYGIIGLTDPHRQVAIYLPSLRVTQEVMHLGTTGS